MLLALLSWVIMWGVHYTPEEYWDRLSAMESYYIDQSDHIEVCEQPRWEILNVYWNPRFPIAYYQCVDRIFVIVYDIVRLERFRLNERQILNIFTHYVNNYDNDYVYPRVTQQ